MSYGEPGMKRLGVEELRSYLPLPVKELRTSKNGDFDWTANCWTADSAILVTDQAILRLESRDDELAVFEQPDYGPCEYPYVIRSSEEYPIVITGITACDANSNLYEEIYVEYENCYVWIIGDDDDGVTLSLQNNGIPSKLPYIEEEYIYRWNFIDSRIIRRIEVFEFLNKADGVWMVRKIYDRNDYQERLTAFVVTLHKDEDPFKERIKKLRKYITSRLLSTELFEEDGHCNAISGDGYSIMIYIEGYKKHANVRGFYTNGSYKVELLHRIGLEGAVRELKRARMKAKIPYMSMRIIMKQVMAAADYEEYIEKYPDLSDRMTAIIMDQCRRYKIQELKKGE